MPIYEYKCNKCDHRYFTGSYNDDGGGCIYCPGTRVRVYSFNTGNMPTGAGSKMGRGVGDPTRWNGLKEVAEMQEAGVDVQKELGFKDA